MIELLTQNPETKPQFFAWLSAAVDELAPVVDQYDNRTLLPQVGELVRRAKYHAMRLGLNELAARLPERAEKTPADGLLRLQECLQPTTEAGYFDAAAAAAFLQMTKQQLYNAVNMRQLRPGRGPKNTYRFTRKQLDDYVQRCR